MQLRFLNVKTLFNNAFNCDIEHAPLLVYYVINS